MCWCLNYQERSLSQPRQTRQIDTECSSLPESVSSLAGLIWRLPKGTGCEVMPLSVWTSTHSSCQESPFVHGPCHQHKVVASSG